MTQSSPTESPAEAPDATPAPPRTPATRGRTVRTRPSRRTRLVQVGVVVAVLAAMGLATEWRSADAPATKAAAEQQFDPAAYGKETFAESVESARLALAELQEARESTLSITKAREELSETTRVAARRRAA